MFRPVLSILTCCLVSIQSPNSPSWGLTETDCPCRPHSSFKAGADRHGMTRNWYILTRNRFNSSILQGEGPWLLLLALVTCERSQAIWHMTHDTRHETHDTYKFFWVDAGIFLYCATIRTRWEIQCLPCVKFFVTNSQGPGDFLWMSQFFVCQSVPPS